MKFFRFKNNYHDTGITVGLSDPIDAGLSSDGRQINIACTTNEVLESARKFACLNWTTPETCPCKQELSPEPFHSEAGDSYFFIDALEPVEVQV